MKKANNVLGLIKRSFDYMEQHTFLTLYCTLVRPILEYGSVIWSPHLKKDIDLIESIQRRATRVCLPKLRNLTYTDRLTTLNLYSLAYRRKRGDLIQVYRILNGLDNIDATNFFVFADKYTRGNNYKLTKGFNAKSVRYNVFSQRIINDWNNLPDTVVCAESIEVFKARVDKFFKDTVFSF